MFFTVKIRKIKRLIKGQIDLLEKSYKMKMY